jgi:hypothetical protein
MPLGMTPLSLDRKAKGYSESYDSEPRTPSPLVLLGPVNTKMEVPEGRLLPLR